jgi:hypothetical protein
LKAIEQLDALVRYARKGGRRRKDANNNKKKKKEKNSLPLPNSTEVYKQNEPQRCATWHACGVTQEELDEVLASSPSSYIDSTLSLPQSLAVCYYLFFYLFIYLYTWILFNTTLLLPSFFSIPSWVFVGLHTQKTTTIRNHFFPPHSWLLFLFCRERSSRQLFTERRNQQHHFLENHFWDWTRVVLMALNVFLKAVEIIGPWISLDHRILGAWRPETWWEADEQTESAVVTG